jgi:polysaccharide biosynthesis protein PelD
MITKKWKAVRMGLPLMFSRFLALWAASLEMLVLTMVLPAIGFGVRANDPFYLNCRFPWLIFAPLLISLRYGFLFGMGSAALLITSFTFGPYFNWEAIPFFPVEMVVGMLLITLVTSEFHNFWQNKLQHLQHKCHYLESRMNEFSRTYHILKASHSQLEQQLTSHAKSMRTSLLDFENQIQAISKLDGEPLKGVGEHILKLISKYGSIQTAALYEVSEGQKLNPYPIACLGSSQSFWPSNPLVRKAFKTGCVTSIQSINEELGQDILVVIPLIDVYQKIWAMVIVNEMPMFALQENTLDMFSLLGGHIGDLIQRRMEANLLSKDIWTEFECELHRILRDARSLKADAAVVVSIINNLQDYEQLMSKFRSELRELDKVMCFHVDFGRQIIINLLPMTDENGLKDFLSRLEILQPLDSISLLELNTAEMHGYKFKDNNVTIYSWTLNDKASMKKILSEVAQLCNRKEKISINGDYSCAEISA